MTDGLALTPFDAAAILLASAVSVAPFSTAHGAELFAVIVQGGTIKRVLERLTAKEKTR